MENGTDIIFKVCISPLLWILNKALSKQGNIEKHSDQTQSLVIISSKLVQCWGRNQEESLERIYFFSMCLKNKLQYFSLYDRNVKVFSKGSGDNNRLINTKTQAI